MNLSPLLLVGACLAALSCAPAVDEPTAQSDAPVRVGGAHAASPIAAGDAHACLVVSGAVRCWGDNFYGQLGNGSTTDALTPVDAWDGAQLPSRGPQYLRATAVSAGGRHSCALRSSGEVSCWGDNARGQLGDGTSQRRTVPTAVPGLGDVVHLAAGSLHTCAALADGSVRCWGDNGDGRLGQPLALASSVTPVAVPSLPRATAVAAGGSHSCALLADGGVACWGDNTSSQLGERSTAVTADPTPRRLSSVGELVAVTAGAQHTCVLRRDGAVYCWGDNASGQLGDGTTTRRRTPVRVAGIGAARAVTAGAAHTCAALVDGTTWCWGSDASGALGSSQTATQSATPVSSAGATWAASVAAGASFTCALRGNGAVLCWGANGQGQLADGTRTGRALPTTSTASQPRPASALALGSFHACAVRGEGRVTCWGSNAFGQLGDGTRTARTTGDVYVDLGGVPAVAVGAGTFHSCALRVDGTVWCWGANLFGELGDGSGAQRSSPVAALGVQDAVAIAVEASSTCALRASGAVLCWGDNTHRMIRNTDDEYVLTPTPIDGISDAVSLATSGATGCATRVDGSLSCWGHVTRCVTPTLCEDHEDAIAAVVAGVHDAVDVALNLSTGMVVRADGTLWCFGRNGQGECALGNTLEVPLGTAVPGVQGVTEVRLGTSHVCARHVDGTLSCWGHNELGQIGDGTTLLRPFPVALSLVGVTAITADESGTCAQFTNAAIQCWGQNSNGRFGFASPASVSSPTPASVP